MGEWHKVTGTLYKQGGSPCNGCFGGFCSISQKRENGELYEKTDYCQETCKQYLEYCKKPERFFGQNTRDAIVAIRGS